MPFSPVYTKYTLYKMSLMSDNEFLHHLDTDMCDSGDQFNGGWAKQILIVKDMIFKEMRETTKVNHNDSLRAESLNVKSITKPTLCYWLELMCCLKRLLL